MSEGKEVEGGSAAQAAFVLLNGRQLMQCQLPTPSEGQCTVYADAQSNLRVMDDTGRFELTCLFYASADVTSDMRPWVAELQIDDGAEKIPLGILPKVGEPRVVSKYIKRYPISIALAVRFIGPSWYPHPEEEVLVEEIQLLLLARAYVGLTDRPTDYTVRVPKLQAKLQPLGLYQRVVVEHYKGNFLAFLDRQPNLSVVMIPGGDALVTVPTPESVTPELRALPAIAEDSDAVSGRSPSDSSSHSGSDKEDSHALSTTIGPEVIEQDTAAAVRSILEREGELSIRQLLDRIVAEVPAWQRRNLKASTHVFVRFLQNRSNLFWVKWDTVHSTRVGLVREEEAAAPRLEPGAAA